MSFILSEQADRDVLAILLTGTEQFGRAHAERYARGLGQTFAFLAEYPDAARLRTDIVPPVRAHPYKAHVIIYDIIGERDIVIVRIRHGREDWLADPRH